MKKYFIMILVVVILLLICLFMNFYIKSNKIMPIKEDNKVIDEDETKEKEVDLMDKISLNYHASIRMEKDDKIIYFDPFKIEEIKNDADYIFITHSHYDHFSIEDIKKVKNENTKFIVTSDVKNKINSLGISNDNILVVEPNNSYEISGLKFDTIPAYNTNKAYHKKEYNWVGYNVTISGKNYYVAGDSDITEEMKKVKCDVFFVPVGGTYTMDYKEALEVVDVIKPKYAIPIHYGEAGNLNDAKNFVNNLESDIKGIILKN